MILLNGHSLTPVRKIREEEQSLTLKERESTTSLKTTDTDGITMTSWLMDETEPGAGIVWRVRSIQQEYAKQTPTIQLEHIINTLRDRILFGEIKADTITGTPGATTCTAQQAVNYILAQQSDWTLYSFDFGSVTNAYKFDGDTLFDALERVSETLDDPWWSYDMSVYPFRLSITHKPSGVACEQRPGRNLVTVSRTVDRNGMYTRFYPVGKEDLHISGNYVSKNENLYGIISKVETDITRETAAELTAWANERLNKHAEPRVTITADGLDLSEATGEPLDRLTLGRICRMPLPEFSTTIEERITELTYRDKIHQPTVVRITMANQQEDIMKLIANEMKEGAGPSGSGRGGGGGRGGARQLREDHAWFEDTDEHVAMVAEGLIGVDAQGNPNWTRLSQIIVDGTGIHAGVKDFIDELEHFQSDFEMNESKISLVVGRYNGQNYIKAGEIALSINNSTGESEALIDANHVFIGTENRRADVVIEGKLNVSELAAKIADIAQVNMLAAHTDGNIVCDGAISIGGSLAVNQTYGITNGGTGTFSGVKLGSYSAFTDCVVNASVSGNTLTLTKASGGTVTFSKATTLTGSWSSGVFSASATGVTTLTTSITGGTGTWSGKTVTIPIYATIGSSATVYNTGKTVTATYSGTGDYDAGWNDALNACGIPNGGTVYTGNWEGTLFRAAYVGATAYAEVQNCISGVRYHQVQPKS